MPTIHFPKKELKKYLKKKVTDKQLQEAVSMLGTDVEKWGKDVSVEIFPDRPDLLSAPGLARALNHYFGFSKKVDTYTVRKPKKTVRVKRSVKSVRPHTRCAIIKGLKLDDEKIEEIIQAQEKLHVTFGRNRKKVAIGIYPLEHIKFPVTYSAQKPKNIVFTPLESKKEMNAKELLEEHPTGKRYAPLLEGQKRYPVFRDANKQVLSVPPIINSEAVGRITKKTKDAFIEVSGHDERVLEQAINMLASMFAEMGCAIEGVNVKYTDKTVKSPNMRVQKQRVSTTYIEERSAVPKKNIASSAKKMGLRIDKGYVTIPCYRTDFLHDVDVIEDVLIGYGYANLRESKPNIYTTGKLTENTRTERIIREILSGTGMIEVMNYYIQDEGVPLANPLTIEARALRNELVKGLLNVLEKNTSAEYPQRIYEIGPIFRRARNETGVNEIPAVSALICQEGASYTQIRQILEALGRGMGWKLKFREHKDRRFIEGRCARIAGSVQGVIGEVHPEHLAERGVKIPVAAFEIRRK